MMTEIINKEILSMRSFYNGNNSEICYKLDVLRNILLSESEKQDELLQKAVELMRKDVICREIELRLLTDKEAISISKYEIEKREKLLKKIEELNNDE